jgi:hypothetical protein
MNYSENENDPLGKRIYRGKVTWQYRKC